MDGSGNTTTQNLTVQGTASLQALTCTGETDTGTLTVSGTGTFGALASSGNLTVQGSYGGYFYATLSTSLYSPGQQDLLWAAPTFSYNIAHTAGTSSITLTNAGVYAFFCKLNCGSTQTSAADCQLWSYTSPDGATWTNQQNTESVQTYVGTSEMSLQGMILATAGLRFKIQFNNAYSSNMSWDAIANWTYLMIYRIG